MSKSHQISESENENTHRDNHTNRNRKSNIHPNKNNIKDNEKMLHEKRKLSHDHSKFDKKKHKSLSVKCDYDPKRETIDNREITSNNKISKLGKSENIIGHKKEKSFEKIS